MTVHYSVMTEKPQTFFLAFRLDTEAVFSGKTLSRGYYRYTYDLGGTAGIPNPCEFSPDRWKWERCDSFKSFGEFREFFESLVPAPVRIESEDYVETITYRGVSVPIFCDDYGQCFYCIVNGKVESFGSFQTGYEDDVKVMIDFMLDENRAVTSAPGKCVRNRIDG